MARAMEISPFQARAMTPRVRWEALRNSLKLTIRRGGVCWAVGRGVLDDFWEYALAASRKVERSRRTTYCCGSSLCVDR